MAFATETKKLALLRIKEILEKKTDKEHCLTQAEIVDLLEKDYHISMERKAVGRNIELLREADYYIETGENGKGVYYDSRVFDDSELRLLIDTIRFSKFIPAKQAESLTKKLMGLSNQYFTAAGLKHIQRFDQDTTRSDNKQLFLNIEVIGQAIDNKKKISFDLYRYQADMKVHKDGHEEVVPVQMILGEQKYYLLGISGRSNREDYPLTLHRIDEIRNVKEIGESDISKEKVEKYLGDITPEKLERMIQEHPDLGVSFRDEQVDATLILGDFGRRDIWQTLVESFGKENIKRIQKMSPIDFTPMANGAKSDMLVRYIFYKEPFRVRLTGGQENIINFLIEHRCQAFILQPASLREKYEKRLRGLLDFQTLGYQDWMEQEMDADDPLEIVVKDYEEPKKDEHRERARKKS